METKAKKTTARNGNSTAAAVKAKPKTTNKPKAEVVPTGDVTNVQVRVTKEKKTTNGIKIHKVATPIANDALVLNKITSIQKAKNWIKRVLNIKK
jgi:hypothetical protein